MTDVTVCAELGVSTRQLHRWRDEYRLLGDDAFPGQGRSRDEELNYDVFAGICDCSQVSAEQLTLMRLLLVYLDNRDRLRELLATVAALGQYTTLLQALEHMDFDGPGWKAFAERSVRDYTR